MIWSLILGAIAGGCAAAAEDRIRPFIERYLSGQAPSPAEMRAISLSVCMVIAAVVGAFSGGGGAVALTVGALIGVLAPRLYAKYQASRAPDYDS